MVTKGAYQRELGNICILSYTSKGSWAKYNTNTLDERVKAKTPHSVDGKDHLPWPFQLETVNMTSLDYKTLSRDRGNAFRYYGILLFFFGNVLSHFISCQSIRKASQKHYSCSRILVDEMYDV